MQLTNRERASPIATSSAFLRVSATFDQISRWVLIIAITVTVTGLNPLLMENVSGSQQGLTFILLFIGSTVRPITANSILSLTILSTDRSCPDHPASPTTLFR